MALKSTFNADLKKEQLLAVLLDDYYQKHLKNYNFERIRDKKRQFQGVDLIFTHKEKHTAYHIDEKAQLDYINEDLPTFAFELSYKKANILRQGWLYDTSKKTEFYSLITGIYSDAPNTFTSCKITLVNRTKLLTYLNNKGITELLLKKTVQAQDTEHGKLKLKILNPKTEGYLYLSSKNKAEQPLNLVLRLDFLLENNLAKRLV